jgi:hypothetical protein
LLQRISNADNANLLSIGTNQANLICFNILVDGRTLGSTLIKFSFNLNISVIYLTRLVRA